MTNEQFNEWLIWYFQCWPDAGAWYRGLPADARAELGRQWFKILGRFARRDLIAACYAQLSGDAEVAPAYQRSLIAASIRDAAASVAHRREQREVAKQSRVMVREAENPMDATMTRAGVGDWYRLSMRACNDRFKAENVSPKDYKRRIEIGTEIGGLLRHWYTSGKSIEDASAELQVETDELKQPARLYSEEHVDQLIDPDTQLGAELAVKQLRLDNDEPPF